MQQSEKYYYYHPIHVRFADLDVQQHVNNAVYLTYLESARLGYYQQVGIWDRDSGLLTGMVVAHIDIDYLAPIYLGQAIQVGLRLARLGNKSFTLDFQIEAVDTNTVFARGSSVMVAYDDEKEISMPLPTDWRDKLTQFENQHQEGSK